jgi:hypothetical protein
MRVLLFLCLLSIAQAQYLDTHLYLDQSKSQLIDFNVDCFQSSGDTVFYYKGNKFYSYSLNSRQSRFINWDVENFSIGPDGTLAYTKDRALYLLQAPYKDRGKYVTIDIEDTHWAPDGTLLIRRTNNNFHLVTDNRTGSEKFIAHDFGKWLIS